MLFEAGLRFPYLKNNAMQNEKINQSGTSSNVNSLKNMEEQSGKQDDGSQAYLDIDNIAAESAHGNANTKEDRHHHRKSSDKKNK
jgi:hypothetical protein